MKIRKIQQNQEGFSLIELILVLGIMSIGFAGVASYLSRSAELSRAEAAGEQIAEIGKALGNYITRESGTLESCLALGQTITIPIGVLNSAGTTTVGGCTLTNRRLLPNTMTNVNMFGTGYNIMIRQTADGTMTGLVLTSAPIRDAAFGAASPPRYDWLGAAMRKAGAQSGMTFTTTGANSLRGLGGGWALPNTEYANINQLGLLGYRVGYQGNSDDIYLRLDGAYPMRGNLNMGNYSINNATDVNFNGWLNGNNALLNNLKTGYISNAGNIQTNTLTATAGIYTGGRETAAKPAGWDAVSSEMIHTWNLYANGIIGVGTAGNVQAYMRNDGLVKANNIYLTPPTCNTAGGTTGLNAVEQAGLRGSNCIADGAPSSYMLTDRLPKYVMQNAQVVANQGVIAKPACSAAGGYSKARIIVTPQIQNIYAPFDSAFTITPVASPTGGTSYNFIYSAPPYIAAQMQVYATEIPGNNWRVTLSSAHSASPQGHLALAETYCDYG